jgi:hypothetical protein
MAVLRIGRETWLMFFIPILGLQALRCWSFLGWRKSIPHSMAPLPSLPVLLLTILQLYAEEGHRASARAWPLQRLIKAWLMDK